ncbi:MAG TPA: VOC family protein [Gaiellaceae bacterium]|nr:VOC family protein [Gaiellaceae bacterium]
MDDYVVFDHVGLNVGDYAASRAFYEQALAPLGYSIVMDFPEWRACGFGVESKPGFWISQREPVGTGAHVAFHCEERAAVDAFHAAALAAGGADNGAPGVREHYHPSYYGAFVLDPDGNNVEAVCHRPA